MENSATHGFRASVFTGPVLKKNDPVYREKFQLPQAFWKVVVTLSDGEDDGSPVGLASSAYVLSQADLVSDLPCLEAARDDAASLLRSDARLALPEHAALRKEVIRRYGRALKLIGVG